MTKKRILFPFLFVILLTQQGCVNAAFMAANIAVAAIAGKSAAESKADRCYRVEIEAEEKGLSEAATKRDLRKAGCIS